MFFDRKLIENDIFLGAEPNQLPRLVKLLIYIETSNTHRSTSWLDLVCQTLERSGFPSAIHTK